MSTCLSCGAGFLPNEIWRTLGLRFGGGIDQSSEVLGWVRAVATAILAGVAIGCAAFVLSRRSIFIGVATGEAAVLAGHCGFDR